MASKEGTHDWQTHYLITSPYSSYLILVSWNGNMGNCFLLDLKNLLWPLLVSKVLTRRSCLPLMPPPLRSSSSLSELAAAASCNQINLLHPWELHSCSSQDNQEAEITKEDNQEPKIKRNNDLLLPKLVAGSVPLPFLRGGWMQDTSTGVYWPRGRLQWKSRN